MRRLTYILLLVIALAPLAATAQPVPIKDFIRFPEYRRAVISPDGSYLAVIMTQQKHKQRYELVVMKTGSVLAGKPKTTARIGLGDRELFARVFWVNNNRLAIATARYFGGFDRPYLDGTLLSLDANSGQFKRLMGNHSGGQLGYLTSGTNKLVFFGGLLSRLPGNRNGILVVGWIPGSNIPYAYKLDTLTDRFFRVATGLFNGGMLADHTGRIRLKWGSNQKTGAPILKYLPPHSMNWKNISSFIYTNRVAFTDFAISGPIMFGPDNKIVYFSKPTGDTAQTFGLYSINMKSQAQKLLYSNPIVDVGYAGIPDAYIKSFDRKSLVGLRYMPGKPATAVTNPHSAKIQLLAALSHAFPHQQVEITSWTRTGNEAVVKTWSDNRPSALYLYSSKPKPSLVLLFHSTPWIKSGDLSPQQPISYKSRDGLTIHGYLTLPLHTKNKKKPPLVIYVHGGPYGIRYDWGFEAMGFDSTATQILASHGYAVLAPNYRGSGGYGLKFETIGFRHWGDTMQNDLDDAAKWAVKEGIADPHRICIFGASYGGYAALMSAERFPGMFQCAIGYSGVYDLPMLKSRKSDISRFAGGRLYESVVLGGNDKQLRAFSPVYNVESLTAAVLLIHGGRDQRAPVKGYDEMVAAIKKHGTPLKTLYERNEGHGFYKPAHREKAWNEILAFLGKYIGPGSTADAKTNR